MSEDIGIKKPNLLLNEGPTVIGMMSVVIEAGGSLDNAIRDIAISGPENSRELFAKVVFDTDSRLCSDLKTGLIDLISKLPNSVTAYRRAIHMAIAAAESNDEREKSRMLKDASDISLSGLREAGESYSSWLNTPCMMVFGLGIMVPMILMSILPMLNIGGMFGSEAIGMGPISMITLIVVPTVVISVTLSIKERNPFLDVAFEGEMQYALYLLPGLPVAVAAWVITKDLSISILLASCIVGAMILATLYPKMRIQHLREAQEVLLRDAVFELGNRLISGENFETAMVYAISIRKECESLAKGLEREFTICRGDMEEAIRFVISPVSPALSDVFCDIYRSSTKDIRDAGRLAISVGRQLQDQDAVRKNIDNQMKSMVDMMSGTAAVFAPLVLGMSISMLKPVSEIMDGVDFGNTTSLLSVYLVELCILMSVLTSYLRGRVGIREIVYRIGLYLPVSMIVFFISTNISF